MPSHTSGLRILVVDNDHQQRELVVELLMLWGYQPFVAEGMGQALLENARHMASRGRCHLALVDVRLLDDTDQSDRSGLSLVQQLQPTLSIILSGLGDIQTARTALRTVGAIDFIAKDNNPDDLQQAIERAALHNSLGPKHHTQITWSDEFSSRRIRELFFSESKDVPDDEANELIGRLFPDAQRVWLRPIDAGLSPNSSTSAQRRRSRVFLVRIDKQARLRVVKIAQVDKIRREVDNYSRYVETSLASYRRPIKEGHLLLWDMGAIVYSYLGSSDVTEGARSFSQYYRESTSAEQVLRSVRNFFSFDSWGQYYRHDVQPLMTSLVDAYDAAWSGALKRSLSSWASHERVRYFPGLPQALPNPTRWFADHASSSEQVRNTRQAVTHGDLHGDNLFVDDNQAWAIDFERSGPGPILRDFCVLIVDILTRLAQFDEHDLPLFYDLAVTICAPYKPSDLFKLPESVEKHLEGRKAGNTIQQLMLFSP